MVGKNTKPSKVVTPNAIPPEVLEDMGSDSATFKRAVARSEELGELARQAAEESIRISQNRQSRGNRQGGPGDC